jgi:hypothetical protein
VEVEHEVAGHGKVHQHVAQGPDVVWIDFEVGLECLAVESVVQRFVFGDGTQDMGKDRVFLVGLRGDSDVEGLRRQLLHGGVSHALERGGLAWGPGVADDRPMQRVQAVGIGVACDEEIGFEDIRVLVFLTGPCTDEVLQSFQ